MKFNTRTEALIRASIDHWARLAELDPMEDEWCGGKDCPLCIEFSSIDCKGCPIRNATGSYGCIGSPYSVAANALWNVKPVAEMHVPLKLREEAKDAAWQMLLFLVNLLPEGHQ